MSRISFLALCLALSPAVLPFAAKADPRVLTPPELAAVTAGNLILPPIQINLNNAAFTIIGVTPPEFAGTMGRGNAPDLTIPLMMEPLVRGNNANLNQQAYWWLLMMGRLKPGVTTEQARAELEPIFQRSALENLSRPGNHTQAAPIAPQDYPRLAVEPGRRGDTNWGCFGHDFTYTYAPPRSCSSKIVPSRNNDSAAPTHR